MVLWAPKRSLLDAACWSDEVISGAGGLGASLANAQVADGKRLGIGRGQAMHQHLPPGGALGLGVGRLIHAIDGQAECLGYRDGGLGCPAGEALAFPSDQLGPERAALGQERLAGLARRAVASLVLLIQECPPVGRELPGGRDVRREDRANLPVFLGQERLDVALALDDDADGDGLDPPSRQAGGDLPPQKRRDLVSDDPVEHPPCLLGVDLVHVHLAGDCEGLADGVAGDFVEDYPVDLLIADAEGLGQVPGDGLALAVKVGRQEDFGGRLGAPLKFGDDLLAPCQEFVCRGEAVLDVHADGLCRQVADMAHRGLYYVIVAEIAVYGLGLGGGFDDDEHSALGDRCLGPAWFGGPWGLGLDFSVSFRHFRLCRHRILPSPGPGWGGVNVALMAAPNRQGQQLLTGRGGLSSPRLYFGRTGMVSLGRTGRFSGPASSSSIRNAAARAVLAKPVAGIKPMTVTIAADCRAPFMSISSSSCQKFPRVIRQLVAIASAAPFFCSSITSDTNSSFM